jgi:hypothetical protein
MVGVVATQPKSAVTFYVDGVARFTFFRREGPTDRAAPNIDALCGGSAAQQFGDLLARILDRRRTDDVVALLQDSGSCGRGET